MKFISFIEKLLISVFGLFLMSINISIWSFFNVTGHIFSY